MNKPSFQYLKENVPIVKVVEALGYTYNRKKGRHPLQYEHPDGDKVIISNKVHPAYQVYFTRHNYTDHGTVVDFVSSNAKEREAHVSFYFRARNSMNENRCLPKDISGAFYDTFRSQIAGREKRNVSIAII
ncbi:MAG: hypothetical protein U5K79_02170 [Cyclobacteriaceae bacterium]|nr:hypothetical protein [Cyclobacteriaceae bacterium]